MNSYSNKWISLGTINHEEGNKTTLNKLIGSISDSDEKIPRLIEEKPKKHLYIADVNTNKIYLSLLLSKENILDDEHIDLISREECLTKALKDIQIEDISKNNKNNKLVLSPKQFGQQLKKKGQHYGKKN